jgi:hypothetical protein
MIENVYSNFVDCSFPLPYHRLHAPAVYVEREQDVANNAFGLLLDINTSNNSSSCLLFGSTNIRVSGHKLNYLEASHIDKCGLSYYFDILNITQVKS